MCLARLQSPYKLDFSTTNKLFNPIQWQKTPDGRLIKICPGNEVGPEAVVITKITPLYLILTLDSIETNELARAMRSAWSARRRSCPGSAASGSIMPRSGKIGEKNDVSPSKK